MDDARPGTDAFHDTGFKELEVVAYIGEFKIVGTAHFGVGQRASSRRPSDYIRAFSDSRLTLSKVRIYDKNRMELVEAAPFIILNLDKVDFLYAREDAETSAGEDT
ncbi:MAG TPA: hypothetical protein VMH50_05315 [Thermoleophilia bacterium]|nr:hypothetical protein [Thermoleophilia bacterium]